MIVNRHATRSWAETGLPGIQSCATWIAENGDGGYLARLNAGSRFPRHSHQGWEQIFVVSGLIRFNDVELQTGDTLQVQGADEHEATALEDTVLFVAHYGGIVFTNA